MLSFLANIRIVLVEPSHPGNIGAVARAMKTMGLNQLYLVNPALFPHSRATAMASQADDILDQAQVVSSLVEGIADCQLVLGASVRVRELTWPTLTAHQAAQSALAEAAVSQVAIIFGREKYGLTNEELQCCHYQVEIPANPHYSSLNLAAAVQVMCYELRQVALGEYVTQSVAEEELATMAELEGFYSHLEQVLYATEFLKPEQPGLIMRRLRRLFNRTCLDKTEVNILRGILTAILKNIPEQL
jgi:tRNA (cytidine32/uridine32-2'-O)-methyltransferase